MEKTWYTSEAFDGICGEVYRRNLAMFSWEGRLFDSFSHKTEVGTIRDAHVP